MDVFVDLFLQIHVFGTHSFFKVDSLVFFLNTLWLRRFLDHKYKFQAFRAVSPPICYTLLVCP